MGHVCLSLGPPLPPSLASLAPCQSDAWLRDATASPDAPYLPVIFIAQIWLIRVFEETSKGCRTANQVDVGQAQPA